MTATYESEVLVGFMKRVFQSFKVPEQDAEQAARVLALADIRGIESHGIARLHTYVGLLREEAINPVPQIRTVRETQATASIDGDNGLGLVVGPAANTIAIDKAASAGSGWVSVCNSNHFGIAGYYVLEHLTQDMIGLAMTNSTPIVAPLWGRERRLGTNPIAIAFPGEEEPPVVIDMATSTVALGKIEVASRNDARIPSVWAIDTRGKETTNPDDVSDGGAILPLGRDRLSGGHKGYCLSSMVDILTGVLSGAGWGPFTPPFEPGRTPPEKAVGKGIGHFFGAWQIAGFADVRSFRKEVDTWIRTFRKATPDSEQSAVIIPGDPERIQEQRRRVNGIRLHPKVERQLRSIACETGVDMPGTTLQEL